MARLFSVLLLPLLLLSLSPSAPSTTSAVAASLEQDVSLAPPFDEEEEEEENTEAPDFAAEEQSVDDQVLNDPHSTRNPTQDPAGATTTREPDGADPAPTRAGSSEQTTSQEEPFKSAAGRVNLTKCLEEDTLCYMGEHCGDASAWLEEDEKYDYFELEPLEKKAGLASAETFSIMDSCDAIALLKWTDTDDEYEFEYHLSWERANLTLKLSKKQSFFLNGGELECERKCVLQPIEISKTDKMFFWRGRMTRIKSKKAATTARPRDRIQGYGRILDKESLAPEAVEGGGEEEKEEGKDKEENSFMTTILFSVLGCIVAAVFIAVVVGMVIQRRQAAHAALKQERLQRAAVSAAARVNRGKPEAAPLLPPSQSGPASDSIENEAEGSCSARGVSNQ